MGTKKTTGKKASSSSSRSKASKKAASAGAAKKAAAPSASANVAAHQPRGPEARGTVAPTLGAAVDPSPHPTAEPKREEPAAGETAAAYVGYQGEPVLVGGDGGDNVVELCRRLDVAGYSTPLVRGEAQAILDDGVLEAVQAFRADHDVEDELTRGGRPAIVGPATWAALNRAVS